MEMKMRWLFALVLLLTPVWGADVIHPDKEFLTQWVNETLTNRTDKTWTPSLHAHSETAAILGTLGGLTVSGDDTLKKDVLVIKGTGVREVRRTPHDPPPGPFFEPMAVYVGISVSQVELESKK